MERQRVARIYSLSLLICVLRAIFLDKSIRAVGEIMKEKGTLVLELDTLFMPHSFGRPGEGKRPRVRQCIRYLKCKIQSKVVPGMVDGSKAYGLENYSSMTNMLRRWRCDLLAGGPGGLEHSEDNALGVVLGNVSIWGGINQKDFLFLFALIKPLQGKIYPAALTANCAGCLNFSDWRQYKHGKYVT